MTRLYLYVFVLIALGLANCSVQDFKTAEELSHFVRDTKNGLTKSVEVNGIKAEVTFRPTDLWVHQELGDEHGTPDEIERLRTKYNDYYYFILSLSRNNKEALHQVQGGMEQYSELVQVLSFRMPEYTTLTTSASDTIPVADFMLNRTYGMSSSTDVLFVFNREKAKEQEWVQFNLNEFGLNMGNQRFRFRREDLDRVPQLQFISMNSSTPDKH